MEKVRLPSYRIVLSDGREIIASADHRWLKAHPFSHKGSQWVMTKNIKVGSYLRQIGPPWEISRDYESGYLAGMLDGEGFISKHGGAYRVGFVQASGNTLDRARCAWEKLGVKYNEVSRVKTTRTGIPIHDIFTTNLISTLQLIGKVRPTRLLDKFDITGSALPNRNSLISVVSVEDIGRSNLVDIETDTHTLIANGVVSHNCLCSLDPDWVSNPNWQQGFSLVHFTKDRFWVEQLQIINRKFMYGGRVFGSGGKRREVMLDAGNV